LYSERWRRVELRMVIVVGGSANIIAQLGQLDLRISTVMKGEARFPRKRMFSRVSQRAALVQLRFHPDSKARVTRFSDAEFEG
jgi:hypothetical protein